MGLFGEGVSGGVFFLFVCVRGLFGRGRAKQARETLARHFMGCSLESVCWDSFSPPTVVLYGWDLGGWLVDCVFFPPRP